jgi:hypothetical protein
MNANPLAEYGCLPDGYGQTSWGARNLRVTLISIDFARNMHAQSCRNVGGQDLLGSSGRLTFSETPPAAENSQGARGRSVSGGHMTAGN